MARSLSGGPTGADAESGAARLGRHVVVAWLLVVKPLALALALDGLLARLARGDATASLVVAAQVGVTAGGIAVGRRLLARADGAWRAVAWWALASTAATAIDGVWRVLPTPLAPSEARIAAAIGVARDVTLALVAAWCARRVRPRPAAAPLGSATSRDSS